MSEQPILQTIPSPRRVKIIVILFTFFLALIPSLINPNLIVVMIPYLIAVVFILLYHVSPVARVINTIIPRYTLYTTSLIRGKFGKIIERGTFFLGEEIEGQWMIEQNSNTVDLSTVKATRRFFWSRKWDLILPPAFLCALSAAMVFEFINWRFPDIIDEWKQSSTPEGTSTIGMEALMLTVVLFGFIIPILALLFFYPLIWGMSDAEVKRYVVDSTGEILVVNNVGESLKNIFNNIAGWGSLAAVAAWMVTYSNEWQEEEVGFTQFLLLQIMILIILAFILLPGMILLLFFYMNLFHGALVNYLRIGLKNEGVPFGTFKFQKLEEATARLETKSDSFEPPS